MSKGIPGLLSEKNRLTLSIHNSDVFEGKSSSSSNSNNGIIISKDSQTGMTSVRVDGSLKTIWNGPEDILGFAQSFPLNQLAGPAAAPQRVITKVPLQDEIGDMGRYLKILKSVIK